MARRVVITGLGAVCPLGVGVKETWEALVKGVCGLKSVAGRGDEWRSLTSTVAGVVPEDQWKDGEGFIPSAERRRMAPFSQYAVAAADMALKDSNWAGDGDVVGVSIGNGIGGFNEIYNQSLAFHKSGQRKVSPLFVPLALPNLAAGHIAMRHGFTGPGDCHSTACTTGADSIGSAYRNILLGDCDMMVAGGAESCIHPLVFAGFGRARSLSTDYNDTPESSCRPFDKTRGGFVLAEGAVVLILEELSHAKRRNAQIYAEISGYGRSMDAHHMTAPHPDGHGAFNSMIRALKSAGVSPAEINYINAHATGTTVGDAAEAAAIHRLLGDNQTAKVGSTKGATGHLLGAAGALEAMFSVLSIKEGVIPPTLNLTEPNVEGAGRLIGGQALTGQNVEVVVSNSFGFGGMNASLVFKKFKY